MSGPAPGYAHVIAIANTKGGVGKTSTAVNVAWWLAHGGFRVCIVDTDAQGDTSWNLGTWHDGQHDEGRALRSAAMDGTKPEPIRGVRVMDSGGRIDLLPGGKHLDELTAVLMQRRHSHRDEPDTLAESIRALAACGEYHFVIVDCPPLGHALQESVFRAARWLLIPVMVDPSSSERGLGDTAARFGAARAHNPDLTLLGVFLFGAVISAHRVIARTKDSLRELLSSLPHGDELVLETTIRNVQATAQAERRQGLTAAELELRAEQEPPWYQQLRDGQAPDSKTPKSATNLAKDYFDLTSEILVRIQTLTERTQRGTA